MNDLKYLKYLFLHKLYVYQEGRKLGLGVWQMLIHDLSKFRTDEWIPYREKFYGAAPELWKEAFNAAWLKHQHRNPHHWQHWVLRTDDGRTKVMEIPDKYRREMLADWRGAGRAISGKDDTREWYEKYKDKMQLHPATRAWIEANL